MAVNGYRVPLDAQLNRGGFNADQPTFTGSPPDLSAEPTADSIYYDGPGDQGPLPLANAEGSPTVKLTREELEKQLADAQAVEKAHQG